MQETPIKILLIEDDEDDYILIRSLFSEAHSRFQLDWVSTYDEGLKALSEGRHDVYLPDYRSKGAFIVSATPFHDDIGRLIGSVYVARDISDYKRAEQERRKLADRLQHSQRMEAIGTLAGGIAHDFNNLLTGIAGYISLAQLRADPGGAVFKFLGKAEENALRARDLTQRLITFSEGGAPIKCTVSLSELIMDSASLIFSGADVTCLFSIPPDLSPLDADERQVGQAIGNLLQNAREAMPGGGVIKIWAENATLDGQGLAGSKSSEKGRYVMISIEDEGSGIAPDVLSKIFDPYYTTKEMGAQKGMGLGLAIAHSIVTKHGGHMEVQSQEGKGSVFRIYLPASG